MNNHPIKILLADDDEDDRLFFEDAIDALPLRTSLKMVENGKELMDYLLLSESPLPDVIFLDLNMPGKNGLDYLTEIRAHPKLQSISVAVYSTSSSEKDIEESFVRGANIYINKPNDFNDLKDVLKKVICTNWQYLNTSFNKESFLLSV
ncbi:response regulator [Marivirga sp. S37H4]|uniref:Response regulator n=1 Tax=Marivirga aurantiaca TaxID=2802615 RepID=A0A935C967_9BACT|nr:response regulator [Marivirga aurantiaca]MBK6264088.1 response regulator [Marivirga aurantiaca]